MTDSRNTYWGVSNDLGFTRPMQARTVTPFLDVFDMKAKIQKKIYFENLLSGASLSVLINPCNFLKWFIHNLLFSIPGKLYIIYTNAIPQPTLWCKGCVVKRFYFIRIGIRRSCQKWSSKAVSIAVAARRTVRVAEICRNWIVPRRDSQVMTSSKRRTTRGTGVYGMQLVIAIQSCLIQLYRCPSWLIYQREQKGLWIVLIGATIT